MAITWDDEAHGLITQAIEHHGLRSGRCAAVARVVHRVATPRDPETRALQMKPPRGARWLIPRDPRIPQWSSHTYVETMAHAVDAVTGPEGHPAASYRESHWHWSETFEVQEVDVMTVDPGIQGVEAGS